MRILCLACALGTMMSLQLTSTEAQGGQANLTVDGAIKNLTDPNPKTRWQGARALREMGERAEASVPELVKAIESDASVDVQVEAILALGAIGKGSPEAVVSLTNIVPKRDRVLSIWAVYALGDSGSRAKDAVPTIVTFLESATEGDMLDRGHHHAWPYRASGPPRHSSHREASQRHEGGARVGRGRPRGQKGHRPHSEDRATGIDRSTRRSTVS